MDNKTVLLKIIAPEAEMKSENATMGSDMADMLMMEDHPLDKTPVLQYFFVVCLALQSSFGTLGNLLVIGSVFTIDALCHTGNAFIVNLALADLCVTAFAQPANIIGALVGAQYFRERPVYCSMVSTLCATGCLSSCWNICMIGINRYVLICKFQYYDKIYTKTNAFLMCVLVWIIIYLIELPNHVGWGDNRFSIVFFVCTFANHVHSYAIFYVLLGVFTPLTATFFCYLLIYLKVKDSKLTRNRILNAGKANTDTTDASSQNNGIGSASDQQSTVTKKFYDDLKIIQALFRVYVIFILMWLPLIILILLHLDTKVDYVWYIMALLVAHGNSSINCLVYAATIDHFRDGYKKLLGFARRPTKPRPGSLRGMTFKRQTAVQSPGTDEMQLLALTTSIATETSR